MNLRGVLCAHDHLLLSWCFLVQEEHLGDMNSKPITLDLGLVLVLLGTMMWIVVGALSHWCHQSSVIHPHLRLHIHPDAALEALFGAAFQSSHLHRPWRSPTTALDRDVLPIIAAPSAQARQRPQLIGRRRPRLFSSSPLWVYCALFCITHHNYCVAYGPI